MTTALDPTSTPTRRPSAPSPACMPRRRVRPKTAGTTSTACLQVDITVHKLTDFFRPNFATFAGCVSIRGTYSPVVAGNRADVVRSLAQWIARHPELGRSALPLRVRLHPSRSHNRPFPIDSTYMASGLVSARLGINGVERCSAPDLTTMTALTREVPDALTLAASSGHVPHPPTHQRVRTSPGMRPAAEKFRARFETRAFHTDRWWGAADRPLLVSEFPDLEEKPDQIDVYTDASCVPGSSFSAIGICCPALGVVASAVLDREFIKDFAQIRVAETAAIAAGVMLLCESVRKIVIHSDSQLALRWWEDTETIPGRWSKLRSYTSHEKKSHRNAEVRWMKGHADCEGNLWADRAARLSLHS
ncbi:RNase H family protein [Corynebacterium variabile]|uniref:RNase H family protein n=1 Tax=Corynebacterium variabile TaxID=1727 RepID=UPI003FD61DAC